MSDIEAKTDDGGSAAVAGSAARATRWIIQMPDGLYLGNRTGAKWTRSREEADIAASMSGGTVVGVTETGEIVS